MINIQGLQKTTLLDYPEHVAATVFFGGCNMRCPFCHNMNIVTSDAPPAYTDEDILSFLSSRRGKLDGVCITGGEPTLCDRLPDFIRLIKNMGFSVKLDTNGTNPDMLKSLLKDDLLDYIAMDVKSSFRLYDRACGINGIKLAPIKESIDLLLSCDTDYEFRTTCVKELIDDEAVSELSVMLAGAKKYYLQGYVLSEFVPDRSLHAVPKEKLLQYVQKLSETIEHVSIRGID